MTSYIPSEPRKSPTKKGKITRIQPAVLSAREIQILDNIDECGVRLTATKMDLEVNYIYQRLYRIRKKIRKSQNFLAQINKYKRESPILNRLLTTY